MNYLSSNTVVNYLLWTTEKIQTQEVKFLFLHVNDIIENIVESVLEKLLILNILQISSHRKTQEEQDEVGISSGPFCLQF